MAVLTNAPQKSESRILSEALVPKGSYVAICLDVEDQFGVERMKYGSDTEKEVVDLTTFYFGVRKGAESFVIRSKPFKLSLHEKSALYQFLKTWLNEAPTAGLDTLKMKGAGAQMTIDHNMSAKGRVYANIVSIAPVMEGLEKLVPPAEEFAKLLKPQAIVEPDQIPF
jgi:hypothetical protein